MSVSGVYQNIENVLRRIDEIKRRFATARTGSSPRFEEVLQEKVRSAEESGALSVEDGDGTVRNASSYDDIIEAASSTFNLPVSLIKAVIRQESNFNELAISSKGAMGLMQLMPDTAQVLGVENPFNARENIFGGTGYLVDLINKYDGNLNKALAAYNAGPDKVNNEVPAIPETRDFVDSVLHFYESYSNFEEGEEH